MAISLSTLKAIVDEKEAAPVLDRFIQRTIAAYISATRGSVAEASTLNDDLIVAAVLTQLKKIPEVRTFLGLNRKGRGQKFCTAALLRSPSVRDRALTVAEKFASKLLSDETALSELEIIVEEFFGDSPKDDSTLVRMLSELVEHASALNTDLESVLESFHGNVEEAERWAREVVGK